MNTWFKDNQMINPFQVDEDPTSQEAADHVVTILGGEGSLAETLGITVKWAETPWDTNGGTVPLPPAKRFVIYVSGAPRPVELGDLVMMLNGDSPDRLRLDLNELGIPTLGPPPLPAYASYTTNYSRNPAALDPGPVPKYAMKPVAVKAKK